MFKPRHIAQVCREAMGQLIAYNNGMSIAHWDSLTDRQRKLSVAIVNFILATPDATPESCHVHWTEKMIHEEGYRQGDLTNEGERAHSDLVSYKDLDGQTKLCYAISIGIVRGLQDIAHRYENCAAQPIEPPVVYAEHAPVLAAVEEQLSQSESTPGDVAIYGIDKPVEEVVDKAVNDAVDGLSEPAVDVQ